MKKMDQVEVMCDFCEVKFTRLPRIVTLSKTHFCSKNCYDEFQRKKSLESGRIIDEVCKICLKKFIVQKSQVHRFSTCSKECYFKAKQKENNGNWKGGVCKPRKSALSTGRYRVWRKAVYERDGYICQGCGQKGGKLTADHIKSWAHNPELRFDLGNGRTLCDRCHKMTYYYNLKRKLTDEQAIEVVERKRRKESSLILSKEFGVSVSLIDRVSKYQTYKHATCHLFGKYFPKTSEEKLKLVNKKE